MGKYAWDVADISKKIEDINAILEKDELSPEERELLEERNECYLSLLMTAVFSHGVQGPKAITNQELLNELRNLEEIIKIDEELFSQMIKPLSKFEILPKYPFKEKITMDTAVKIVGDATQAIFGDEAYRIYKKYIIDKPNNIQLSMKGSKAYILYFTDRGEEEVYIAIPNDNDFRLVQSLSHEFGHLYRLIINDFIVEQDYLLKEFDAYSYEIRVLDYCLKNNIFKQDAIAAFIHLFKNVESLALIMQMDQEYQLHKKLVINEVTKIANNFDLYKRSYRVNNGDLLDYLEYILTENVLPYFYSLLAVFNTLDKDSNLSLYHDIINLVGAVQDTELASAHFSDAKSFNNLEGYKKYRKEVLDSLK